MYSALKLGLGLSSAGGSASGTPALPSPSNQFVDMFGDSRTYRTTSVTPGADNLGELPLGNWGGYAMFYSGNRAVFIAQDGVSGESVADMNLRLSTVTGRGAGIVTYLAGVNGGSVPTEYQTAFDALYKSSGANLVGIVMDELPNGTLGAGSGAITTHKGQVTYLAAAALRTSYPNIVQAETYELCRDPAGATTDSWFKSPLDYAADNVHPDSPAAGPIGRAVGLALKSVLEFTWSPIAHIPSSAADAYDGSTNVSGAINSNFMMTTQTGGTLTSATGTLPANYFLDCSTVGAGIVSATTSTDPDGFVETVITINGTPAGNCNFSLTTVNTAGVSAANAGDHMVAVAYLKIDAGSTGLSSAVQIGVTLNGTGGAVSHPKTSYCAFYAKTGLGDGFEGTVVSQRNPVDANWASMTSRQCYPFLKITLTGGVAVNAVIRVGRLCLKKAQYVAVIPNRAPTDISLSGNAALTVYPQGTFVGTVSGTDPDGDTMVFTLTNTAGGMFQLTGGTTIEVGATALTAGTKTITLRATDVAREGSLGGLTYDESFNITVAAPNVGGTVPTVATIPDIGML